MKNNSTINKIALSALLATVLPFNLYAEQGDIKFTKDTGKGVISNFGSKKAESYDVAVLVKGNGLKGMTIKSVTLPFKSKSNISNLKVWLTSKLALKTEGGKKVNDANILSQDVNLDKDTVTVTFDSPYTIDADSVYIGYSFATTAKDDASKSPILITSEQAANGFFIHSSRTYRSWVDYSNYGTSTISAVLGNAKENSASFGNIGSLVNGINKTTDATIDIVNYGANGVKSLDYSYTVGAEKGSSHLDLPEALPAIYGASGAVTLSLPAMAEKGNYPVAITVEKVNGTSTEPATTTGELTLYKVLPKHRAVMEEYTGAWCGFCPRGLVGLEVMNRLYPDDFIGLSYHNSDAMEVMSSSQYPADISGFPAGWLDRKYEADAYYGWNDNSFGVDKAWKSASDDFAPVAVTAKAKLTKDGNFVDASAQFTFVKDIPAADYHVEFVLVSDSLTGTGTNWTQSNYYANGAYGGAETFPEPEFKPFYEGASKVEGIYFPDVVVATSRLNGEDVVLPTSLKEDETMDATYQFDLSKVVNTSGESLIQKKNCLRVAALLVDGNGNIVNAAKAQVDCSSLPTGISVVSNHLGKKAAKVIYNMAGQRVSSNTKGLVITKDSEGYVYKTIK